METMTFVEEPATRQHSGRLTLTPALSLRERENCSPSIETAMTFERMPPGKYRLNSQPNPADSGRKYTPEQIVTVKPGDPATVKMIYE